MLFAWAYDGDKLPPGHGVHSGSSPHKYAYKGAKWVDGIEFLTEAEPGYWEKRATPGRRTRGERRYS